jgi:UDP:flavonoid glycosyltransferase YjiC (YdhE family)
MLAPLGFFSAYDPPVLPPAQWLSRVKLFGPRTWKLLFAAARRMCRPWCSPWVEFRRKLGLPPTDREPLFEGQHSPHLVLAMFSSILAAPQRDWPAATQVTGFSFYDRDETRAGLSSELRAFLDAGEPPIVFTLGSSAVLDAGTFYTASAEAAKRLKRRAILLIGRDQRNRLSSLPEGVIAAEYAPYSELFPRAAAIVHQGGAGTTGQALRAGKPMLFMPYAHDQPDNAKRVADLGAARVLSRYRYTPDRAAAELRPLLDDRRYADRAAEVGKHVRNEDGVQAACVALERLLACR